MNGTCPNCGGAMEPYRTERQHAHNHIIVLRWSICTACRHVALQSWTRLQETVEMGNHGC